MKVTNKIALATAAALAFMGISAVAHAAPLVVTVAGVTNATTSAAPKTVAIPESNVIDSSNTVALTATADTGTVVSYFASGVKLVSILNTNLSPVSVASGVTSVSAVSQTNSVTEYAYTTSSSVGSVTITNGSYSTIVYIQGIAGSAANVALSVPSNVASGTVPTFSVSVTDVFGNAVASEPVSVALIGTTFSDSSITKTLTTSAVNSARGVTPVTVVGSATGTLATAVTGSVTVVATDSLIAATATGLPASVKSAIATFNVSDLNAQISVLNAQVASLNAQLNSANTALATEKAAHVADNASLATANASLALANTALAGEKAAHVADNASASKSVSDSADALKEASDALATEKAAHVADNALTTAKINAANKTLAKVIAKYNVMAKKYKFAALK
jgi:hypothetical protein